MSSATKLPFFRLILVYIGGLLLAIYYSANVAIILMLLVVLIIVYLTTYIRSRRTGSPWLNTIGVFIVFSIGYTNLLLEIAQKIKLPKWVQASKHLEGYTACIEKVYDPLSSKALITQIRDKAGWHDNHSFIQLYFSKRCSYKPKKGDKLLIVGTPVQRLLLDATQYGNHIIQLPSIHRHFLKQLDQDFSLTSYQTFDKNLKWAESIRKWCRKKIEKNIQNQQHISLISTLLWGDKEGLDQDVKKAYADTGTIHVLAISGLHVGMFYYLIYTLCKFLFKKIGCRVLSELCTFLWLWLYAWLCCFSPPILRATIMITMARLGFIIGRRSNSYNGWLTSAFALLLWDPFLLLNCGFQLSYLATLAILYLQPAIYSLIPLKNYWLRKIWVATTLSIAAQLGTLPLILYYFKTFPLYFIIANWVVVPAIFVILMLSLGLLVGSQLPIVSKLLGFILSKLIFATNQWVCWIAKWPMSKLSLYLVNPYAVGLLYIFLLAICFFFQHKRLIYAIIITFCTVYYTINQIKETITEQKECQMICYNNEYLSFTLKDDIEALNGDVSPSTTNLLRHYIGGTIAIWYNKVIITIDSMRNDWYKWHGAKLPVDYLLIEEKLLDQLPIICKVFDIQTLVVYTKQVYTLRYHPIIQKLGIKMIWLQPNEQKILTWSKRI